jgi:N-formylglutamate amidohydrolase
MIPPNSSESEFVTLVPPRADPVPALFDSPHSGTNYPDNFDVAIDHLKLRRTEDTFIDELFAAVPDYGATLIAARFPRCYVDPNRSDLDIDPAEFDGWQGAAEPTEKSRIGKGLIWTRFRGMDPLYTRPLTGDEALARIDKYWRPYHDAIAAAYDRIHEQFGCVYHADCHSMPSMGNIHDPDGETARPDFVISDHEGKSCSPAFFDLVVDYLRNAGFDVAINFPFKGGELTRRYSDPAANRHSLQIEINRKLYMDEVTIKKNSDFTKIQNFMTDLAQAVCNFAADQTLGGGN